MTTTMPADARAFAEAARGFMPTEEGVALWRAALYAPAGAMLEVGSYCGKSACYLGAAVKQRSREDRTGPERGSAEHGILFCVDHHRGSEENQAGWEHHEPDLVDPTVGKMDTLPTFRRTVHDAGLEDVVVAVVGDGPRVARSWSTPLALLFIDGGHGKEPARLDFELWTPHVASGGLLVIHDVFPDPAEGGRPPFEQIYLPALASGLFEEVSATGSLRVLERVP